MRKIDNFGAMNIDFDKYFIDVEPPEKYLDKK